MTEFGWKFPESYNENREITYTRYTDKFVIVPHSSYKGKPYRVEIYTKDRTEKEVFELMDKIHEVMKTD